MSTQPAAYYTGSGRIEVGSSPVTEPGPGQVRLDVAYVGICGTDLHILHGAMDHRARPPAILGHEMSGRVADIGPGVGGWTVGDPVTVMPLRWCGDCPACRAGHQHVCQHLDFVGIDSAGALQRSWTVDARVLVRLPDDLSLRMGVVVEPTAVAVHDVRRSGLVPGEQVVVVGAGPVGLLVATVARHTGGQVMVVEIDPYRRAVAERLGFLVADPSSEVQAAVEAWTDGAGVDVAFEVAGSQPALDLAVASLSVRGRLVLVAIHPQPKPVDLQRVFWRELTLIGARVYELADFVDAVELVRSGVVPVDELVSSVLPLSAAAEAFATLDGGGSVMKVLVDCQPEVDG